MKNIPSIRTLRIFSITAIAIGALLAFVAFKRENFYLLTFAGLISVGMLVLQPFPTLIRRIYDYWMAFSRTLGWFNSRVILTLIFYLIVTPIGLLMRLLGKRSINFSNKIDAQSVWQECELHREDHWTQMY